MPAISSSITDGLDAVAFTVSDTNWATFTFPDWVDRVQVRSRSGDFYWSRSATGSFSASGLTHNTVPNGQPWVVEFAPARNPLARMPSLQLSHSSATGTFEFELLGGGR